MESKQTEIWKNIGSLNITESENSFEPTKNCIKYIWNVGKLSANQDKIERITFNTNLCGEKKTWILFMRYRPKSDEPFYFVLKHFGRSPYLIIPELKISCLKGEKLIFALEDKDPISFISDDCDNFFNYTLNNCKDEIPTVNQVLRQPKYHLRVEIRILYDLSTYNYMRELWNYLQSGPYVDLKKTLLERKGHNDLVVISGSNKFYVEMEVLTLRSEFFFSIYKHKFFKNPNELKIDDFSSEVVYEMLNFIYTSNVENIDKHVFDLLELADRYKIITLTQLCAETLAVNLSMSNISKTIKAANRYKLDELKEEIINFIENLFTVQLKELLDSAKLKEAVSGIYNIF